MIFYNCVSCYKLMNKYDVLVDAQYCSKCNIYCYPILQYTLESKKYCLDFNHMFIYGSSFEDCKKKWNLKAFE